MPVSVKVGGVWKTATAVFNKVGGAWKTASDMPVKVGGVWKTGILAPATGYYAIAHAVLSGDTTVTFSSIPQGYTDLKIVAALGGTDTTFGSAALLYFNGITAGSYFARYQISGDSSSSVISSASNALNFADIYTGIAASGGASASIIDIPNYSNTTKEKAFIGYQGHKYTATTPTSALQGYNWASTSAINSISITPYAGTFYGTMTLYGIKAAS